MNSKEYGLELKYAAGAQLISDGTQIEGHASLFGPGFQHTQAGGRKNRAGRIHSGSPQRGCNWCGRPSWSRMRATTKSTMSATVRGWV